MAFLVQNSHRTFSAILKKTFPNSIAPCSAAVIQPQNVRSCTTFPNPKLTPIEDVDLNAQPNIEIIKNPPEWKLVERILPQATVPVPPSNDEYPSGWTPQKPEAFKHPYFVTRSRNFMVPVYLRVDMRGHRRTTTIKNINGDIWELYHDAIRYIKEYMKRDERAQVNEFTRQIIINGDYVNLMKKFLISKGF